MSNNHIELVNVSKSYPDNTLFKDFSYDFKDGFYTISGANGCGKSTLLRMISGAENTMDGDIIVNGFNLKSNGLSAKKIMGYAPDKLQMFPFIKGEAFINLLVAIKKISDTDIVEKMIDGFELNPFLNTTLSKLSLGNQKKFMLLGALMGIPKILLLDEPTNSLDANSKAFLTHHLKTLKEHIIIAVSHDEEFISNFSTVHLNLSLHCNKAFS